jgi:DNA-binding CsgD family transcriptional regulator
MSDLRSRKRLRDTYRLVTEVCQLGHDARAWTSRLMEGLAELFDAKFVGIAWASLPDRPGEFNRGEVELRHGFTDEENQLYNQTYYGENGEFKSEFLRRLVNIPSRFVTIRRQDFVTDDEWYASPIIDTVHRQLDIDANITSYFVSLSMGRLFGIAVHRHWGKSQFTVADCRQMRRLHLELARAWRTRFSSPNDQDGAIRGLPERLRQVLWLLCLGRNEKEIAVHLDISRHTVHNHVKRLHEALGVRSRGELIARAFVGSGSAAPPLALPGRELNEFGPA